MDNVQDSFAAAVDQRQHLDNGSASNNRRNDAGDRKLFVGGMHQKTGEQELRDHFGKYGEIEHVTVKKNPATGRSLGFGFIAFKSSEALTKVEAAGDHVINGKKVDAKKAKSRPGRIFVGGLSSYLTDEDIKTHFAQFGTIVEAHMPFDKIKNQRRDFCFIEFGSDEVVRNLLRTPKQIIKGKQVDVRRARSKPEQPSGPMQGGRGDMRGARGDTGMQGSYGSSEQTFTRQESQQAGGSMQRGGGSRGGYGRLLFGDGVLGLFYNM